MPGVHGGREGSQGWIPSMCFGQGFGFSPPKGDGAKASLVLVC
jgi:hypothetical protein